MITVRIDVRPVAKQSTRFGGGRAYTSRRHLVYAGVIATALAKALEEQPWLIEPDTPISVEIQAHFRWPKSTRKAKRKSTEPRVSVPDCDNIAKPVLDSLSALLSDDRQVADLRVRKLNAPKDQLIIIIQQWHYPLEPVE